MTKRHRREDMVRLLQQRDEEGLTLNELSARSGVPAGTLGYWSAKLRREREAAALALVPVELVEDAPRSALAIELGGDVRIMVEPDFDAAHLARLLDVFAARC
jgi:transposase-like protein